MSSLTSSDVSLNQQKDQKKEEQQEESRQVQNSDYNASAKWRYTLYTTVIFLLIANPYAYKLVQKVLGRFVRIINTNGCPTTKGLLIHALVFTLILRAIMG
jgi:hypothetical protein